MGFYYQTQLGNAFIVGIGSYEIAKFWFDVDDGSSSPLSKEKAESLASKLVNFLNTHHPVTDSMKNEYGDSTKTLKKITVMNKIENDEELNDDEKAIAFILGMEMYMDKLIGE